MSESAPETATPVAPKFVPEVRNGQAERSPGTAGRRAWDFCDAISARKGEPASSAEVVAEATAAGMNPGQVRAAYSKWRKFHGLSGTRIANPEQAAKKAEAEAAKAAKAASAATKKAEAEAAKAAKAASAATKKAEKEAKAAQKIADKEAKAADAAAQAAADAQPAPEVPADPA